MDSKKIIKESAGKPTQQRRVGCGLATCSRSWDWLGRALSLGTALGSWAGLFYLSHRQTTDAILRTNRLFGWVILVSYVGLWAGWVVPRWSQRGAWFRCGAVQLAVVIAWLGLELSAALKVVDWGVVVDRLVSPCLLNHQYRTRFLLDGELEYRRPAHEQWSGPAASDLETQWLVRPGSRRLLSFTYDAQGYRNASEMGAADVLLIGDSFVEGWYVTDEENIARVLEGRLGKGVANLGVGGYGPRHELAVLKREAPRLRPKAVVWFFFEGNDFYDDWRFERTLKSLTTAKAGSYAPGQPVAQAHAWRERCLAGNCLRLLRAWSDPLIPNRMPYFGQLARAQGPTQMVAFGNYASVPWSPWLEGRWQLTQSIFEEGARFCGQHGIELLLCYVPEKFRVYRPFIELPDGSPCESWKPWPLPARFAEYCRARQFAFIDLTGPLQESVQQGGMPYPATESHWGAEGHRLVARIVQEELERWKGP